MKVNKGVLFIAFSFLFTINVFANNWYRSFEDAQKLALASEKFILVDFWATWCGPCKKMDRESWSQPEVQELMTNFIPLQIDIDSNQALAKQYSVLGIPYIFIMDGNGTVVYKSMSYKPKAEVIKLLEMFSLNTSFLNKELLTFHKKDNYVNAMRIASKYSDFSLYIDDTVRSYFLNTSNSYFELAEKRLSQDKPQNQEMMLQRISLYEIKSLLIKGKMKKAKKQLSKLGKDEIDKINKSMFNMLSYIISKKEGNAELAEELKLDISATDLKRAKLILNV